MAIDEFKRKPGVFVLGAVVSGAAAAILIAAFLHFALGMRSTSQPLVQSFVLAAIPFAVVGGVWLVRFHDTHGWGTEWLSLWTQQRLSSPARRIWFLASLAGLGMITISFIGYRGNLVSFLEVVVFDPDVRFAHSARWNTILFWLGLFIFIAGLAFSFAYKYTLGRLISWIKHG